MLGIFGSYVNTTGLLENTDIIDEIYNQEVQRLEADKSNHYDLRRENFGISAFCITAPEGTQLMLNNNPYCVVSITATKQLNLPFKSFNLYSCKVIGGDVASVNCRYIY